MLARSIPVAALIATTQAAAIALSLQAAPAAQQPPPAPREPFMGPAPAPAPLERLGPTLFRIGAIQVDTKSKELSVAGTVNDVQVLEFLANTKGGWKAYESALELDTNAVNFNVACLLIGLDTGRAVAARYQFDPVPPSGDPVEIFVEWAVPPGRRRVRAEELIYNVRSRDQLAAGPWVYVGSSFIEGNRYLAETEGTLIGFMHTRAPIVESPRPLVGEYGQYVINPMLDLKAGTNVELILRALPRQAPGGR